MNRIQSVVAYSMVLSASLLAWSAPVSAQDKAKPPAAAAVQDTKVVPLMNKVFSDIRGKEGTMLTVEMAPGAASSKHRHNAHTFVYMLEGSVVMQVNNDKPVTLKPGDTFYESPKDIHTVSKNASSTQPAKFLVFFVKKVGAAPVVPVK